jgi:hypothetical protein
LDETTSNSFFLLLFRFFSLLEIADLLYDAEHPEIAAERERKRLDDMEKQEKAEKEKEKEKGHQVFKRQKAQGTQNTFFSFRAFPLQFFLFP